MPNASYHIATYEMPSHTEGCGVITNHGGLSKQSLYEVMLQSQMFLYPLKLPSGPLFHKVVIWPCIYYRHESHLKHLITIVLD